MFSFGIVVENTPLSTHFEIQDTATYTGSKIIVWYSENGIDFLSVDMPWKIGGLVQEPQRIIPSEDALAIVKNQVDGILTYQNVSYYDPFLEYRYKQEKDKWILYPVWTVKVSYQMMANADTASDMSYRFGLLLGLRGQQHVGRALRVKILLLCGQIDTNFNFSLEE